MEKALLVHLYFFITVCYLTVDLLCHFSASVGQELGSGLAGWVWLRVAQAVAIKLLARLQPSKGLIVATRSTCKVTHLYSLWQEALLSHLSVSILFLSASLGHSGRRKIHKH